jgi:carboxypeptidase C (cathepsin A)
MVLTCRNQEARNNATTAPTSIYLGGGPGYSSFDGSAVFPCYFNADGNSTTLNEHSWNNHVNMLYIDQPFGVGYSYTTALNGTLNTLDQSFSPITTEAELPQLNLTTIQGTLHAGGPETVANTTMSAARTFWSFAQVWFNE